jgi:malate dehydrogenase
MKEAVKVAITGAAGQISYSLIPHLLSGSVFGKDVPIRLSLVDIPPSKEMLEGVVMEIEDLAEPLFESVTATVEPSEGFKDCDYVIFLGAFPRREGMERKDVMARNVGIFNSQGAALQHAKPGVKCLVVGNPANTNALILSKAAPSVPPCNITALTRLDHNRAKMMIALRAKKPVESVEGVIIWGNHSSTQYPDVRQATVDGSPVLGAVDKTWLETEFISTVQKRGAAVIAARKLSSAASAAKAICDHLRDWHMGTGGKVRASARACVSASPRLRVGAAARRRGGAAARRRHANRGSVAAPLRACSAVWLLCASQVVSMGVTSDGNSYGVPEGLVYSFPCKCTAGAWEIVRGYDVDAFSQAKMDATAAELQEEKALAQQLLQ